MYATPSMIKLGSVTFELKEKTKLSHSTYKMTSYVEFTPYLNSFQQFHKSVLLFKRDISNLSHVRKVVHTITYTESGEKTKISYNILYRAHIFRHIMCR